MILLGKDGRDKMPTQFPGSGAIHSMSTSPVKGNDLGRQFERVGTSFAGGSWQDVTPPGLPTGSDIG